MIYWNVQEIHKKNENSDRHALRYEGHFCDTNKIPHNYPKDDNADERYEILAGTKNRDLFTSEQLPYM